MGDRVVVGSRRGWPWGLVGMIGLALVAELAFARGARLGFSSIWATDRVVTARASRMVAGGCKLLCFGDSMAKLGFAPAILEQGTGLKSYNLAVHGGHAPETYYQLKRALERGARPSAVVVDYKARFLRCDPRDFIRPWSESLDLAEGFEMARTAGDAGFFGSFLAGRLIPSARARHEIRANVKEALTNQAPFIRNYVPGLWRNWGQNRGSQMMPEAFQMVPEDYMAFHLGPWSCHPINDAYVRRFLRLAGRHGVAVFWVLMPVLPETQAGADGNGFDAAYARYVRDLQGQFPNLVVLDGRHSGYDRTALADPMHLNARGAGVLSADIASAIDGHLGRREPGRWLELPAYAARRVGRPAEDLNESNIALQDPGRLRR